MGVFPFYCARLSGFFNGVSEMLGDAWDAWRCLEMLGDAWGCLNLFEGGGFLLRFFRVSLDILRVSAGFLGGFLKGFLGESLGMDAVCQNSTGWNRIIFLAISFSKDNSIQDSWKDSLEDALRDPSGFFFFCFNILNKMPESPNYTTVASTPRFWDSSRRNRAETAPKPRWNRTATNGNNQAEKAAAWLKRWGEKTKEKRILKRRQLGGMENKAAVSKSDPAVLNRSFAGLGFWSRLSYSFSFPFFRGWRFWVSCLLLNHRLRRKYSSAIMLISSISLLTPSILIGCYFRQRLPSSF